MRRELRIKGSFAQIDCFPRALAYLESKKVNIDEREEQVKRLLVN